MESHKFNEEVYELDETDPRPENSTQKISKRENSEIERTASGSKRKKGESQRKLATGDAEMRTELNTGQLGSFKEDFIEGMNKQRKKKTQGYSKYDFIKVKVFLDQHFYILSRFLISRTLTLCKIPNIQSISIAKDIKKALVEEHMLEISQTEFHKRLYDTMAAHGYGELYAARYKLLTQFYQKRVPLVILITGTVCCAKSLVATMIAERMNISNVIQSDIIETVMNDLKIAEFEENLRLTQKQGEDKEVIERYIKDSLLVRRGANTDILKAFNEGKALIVEGYTVHLQHYVKKILTQEDKPKDPEKAKKALKEYLESKDNRKVNREFVSSINTSDHLADKFKVIYPTNPYLSPEQTKIVAKNIEKMEQIDQKGAVIVPIILVMREKDHAACIENWLIGRNSSKTQAEIQEITKKYQQMQQFIIDQGGDYTIVPVSINNLEDTLEIIQDIIIEKIDAAYKRNEF